jgi:hypothetical protein
MLSSLMTAQHDLKKVLEFMVEGIHSEQVGSRNRPWDSKVATAVADACSQVPTPIQDSYG